MKYTEGSAKIDSLTIHYYRTGGDKPPLVLLHGALSRGLSWTPVAEVLAEQYDVLMPDAQGHGLSSRLTPDFSFERIADHTVLLLEKLGITDPIIMGHSMGAGNALQIGIRYPRVPKAIILEDGPALATREVIESQSDKGSQQQKNDIVSKELAYTRMNRDELAEACRLESPAWSDEEIALWVEARSQADPGIIQKLAEFKATDIDLVRNVICPLLLIIADQGILTPDTARQVAALWQAEHPYKWVRIDGAGHGIHRDQYAKFMEVVTGFLKSL